MSDVPLAKIRSDLVQGVAIIDLLPRELTEPAESARLGAALRSVLDANVSDRLLLNLKATHYLSSSAFAALLSFGLRARETNARVAICRMDPAVRFGANIIRLGDVVPIYDDEPTALAALIV
ncbi:MAG TPA: STAS domain-containing protein [Isosphaeraceae bacterium]